jgi:hypothetical protein
MVVSVTALSLTLGNPGSQSAWNPHDGGAVVDQQTHSRIRPFLLMEGGPLYQIERRLGLIKDNSFYTKKRAFLAALLAWLPLLILSALQGTAIGHKVAVPYLSDFGTYTRFLLTIPLLLLAELILGPRIAGAAAHFVTSGVVVESGYERFANAVDEGLKSRDSVLAEVIIAILALVGSVTGFRSTGLNMSTWYATYADAGQRLTWAGWWVVLVSAPLLQFLLIRWLWRLFLWFRFLARINKLDLHLYPTHPDSAGGLGFVGEVQRFFGIILFAYSVGACGVIARDIVYGKQSLRHFAPAIVVYAFVGVIIIVLPLSIFSPRLLVLKRLGLHRYGALATGYTGAFDRKWIDHDNPEHDPLLGTGDIQSLADLGTSYSYIQRMNALPVDLRSLLHLVILTLLPLTPLVLTVMPLKDVLKLILKLLT